MYMYASVNVYLHICAYFVYMCCAAAFPNLLNFALKNCPATRCCKKIFHRDHQDKSQTYIPMYTQVYVYRCIYTYNIHIHTQTQKVFWGFSPLHATACWHYLTGRYIFRQIKRGAAALSSYSSKVRSKLATRENGVPDPPRPTWVGGGTFPLPWSQKKSLIPPRSKSTQILQKKTAKTANQNPGAFLQQCAIFLSLVNPSPPTGKLSRLCTREGLL